MCIGFKPIPIHANTISNTCQKILINTNTDMGIVLLGFGSIFANFSGSSPNLKIFEAIYGLRGNN